MAQADSKVLVLGALAGAAGVGLALVCYRGLNSKRRSSWPGVRHHRGDGLGSGVTVVDGPGLPRGQAEVLERLEALIQCVSELKEEMRALKTALPALQDHVREELRGHGAAGRAGPLHRTRRKRTAGTTSRPEGQSSEDAESEGGYVQPTTLKLIIHNFYTSESPKSLLLCLRPLGLEAPPTVAGGPAHCGWRLRPLARQTELSLIKFGHQRSFMMIDKKQSPFCRGVPPSLTPELNFNYFPFLTTSPFKKREQVRGSVHPRLFKPTCFIF